MTREPILRVDHVNKAFGAVQALTDVSLQVWDHEVVALVGDNAAGKSTLARIISGAYQPDSGQICVDGRQVVIGSPRDAFDLGIASVFQELALCENLDVVANIFLGREIRRNGMALDETQMESQARRFIDLLGGRIPDVRVALSTLSGGQRQCVAIARTLVANPDLLVLDEPTASLSVAQTADVLNHIEGLREMGKGVIFISHNLTDVRAVADRVIVLRHGRINGVFRAREATYEEIIASITGLAAATPTPGRP